MDEFTVVFTDQAVHYLDQIIGYLSENWPETVKTNFLATLSDTLKLLSHMPFIYRVSLSEPGLR